MGNLFFGKSLGSESGVNTQQAENKKKEEKMSTGRNILITGGIWYGMTKAGLINMTKSFAKLLGPQGVVVNAVAAGPVETDMLATIPEPRKKAIKEAVYTGRFAYPEEVAEAMFWLATDCPEYINGTCLDINLSST